MKYFIYNAYLMKMLPLFTFLFPLTSSLTNAKLWSLWLSDLLRTLISVATAGSHGVYVPAAPLDQQSRRRCG